MDPCELRNRDVSDELKRWTKRYVTRRKIVSHESTVTTMGQDWCARRRKRLSNCCCPCGPRVHPSNRSVSYQTSDINVASVPRGYS